MKLPRIGLFFVLALLIPLSAEERTVAEQLAWLDANRGDPQTALVLRRLSQQITDPVAASDTILKYLDLVDDDREKSILASTAGRILLSVYDFDRAEEAFAIAISADPLDWNAYISRSLALQEIGLAAETVPLLTQVILHADSVTLQRRAAILRTRAFLLTGEIERALDHAASLVSGDDYFGIGPQAFYLAREAALAADDPILLERAGTVLAETFGESPEQGLISGRITSLPVPSRILSGFGGGVTAGITREPEREKPPEPTPETRIVTAIQTGSFRDAENARYMARDLGTLGFTAIVQESTQGFFRVLVPVSDQPAIQNIVVRLKERGYEGFLLFADSP